MKRLSFWTILILASCPVLKAQDPPPARCPAVSVNGSAGIVNVRELAQYTVTVEREAEYQLEFVWTTSGGRIKDGQGTKSIRVIMPDDTLLVTVDVKGLPAGCPSTASEYLSCRLKAPVPEKTLELQPAQAVTRTALAPVVRIMLENPNNQLYILAGDVGRRNSVSFQKKCTAIRDLLARMGIERDRIAMTRVYSDVELFQFWRVPPGADNPRCSECDELEKAISH